MNREDYLKLLNENPDYQKVLSLSKDEKETRILKGLTEKFLLDFAQVIEPIRAEIERDPEGFKNLLQEIDDSILNVSGSTR